ncbi:MAG: hypothetical protein BWY17_01357 [Deltaproteobacteria bacterium ADurb.Bin207]|nr:MAG: hypothetical protein BWY17_01357 [Deltaproteobacteria bacterium ADurb.Bin207]
MGVFGVVGESADDGCALYFESDVKKGVIPGETSGALDGKRRIGFAGSHIDKRAGGCRFLPGFFVEFSIDGDGVAFGEFVDAQGFDSGERFGFAADSGGESGDDGAVFAVVGSGGNFQACFFFPDAGGDDDFVGIEFVWEREDLLIDIDFAFFPGGWGEDLFVVDPLAQGADVIDIEDAVIVGVEDVGEEVPPTFDIVEAFPIHGEFDFGTGFGFFFRGDAVSDEFRFSFEDGVEFVGNVGGGCFEDILFEGFGVCLAGFGAANATESDGCDREERDSR